MPWQSMSMDEQRRQFVRDYQRDVWTMTELCARYAVARKTGYKWVARYEALGCAGLQDRSRRPQTCPTAVPAAVVHAIVTLRHAHPQWGPRKLRAVLVRRAPEVAWPARSTVAKVLRRAGLVDARVGRVRRPPAAPGRRVEAHAPNDVWTADFKGQFRTGDGRYCYPLTVLDRYSRFALESYGMAQISSAQTRARFTRLFATYGLPTVLRTDNGTPFASTGLAGLSQLAVWWMRLGIRLDRITPGRPQENGGHERFHRTLKAETACPPAADLRRQQTRFARHRREYNEERPHEALGDQPPARLYQPSPRALPRRVPPVDYPGYFEVRRVGSNGCVRWQGRPLCLTTALIAEEVGFEPIDDGLWVIYFAAQPLARFDERAWTVVATAACAAPYAAPLVGEGAAPGA